MKHEASRAHPGQPAGHPGGQGVYLPRLIAWEVTRTCNLSCIHCRASARLGPYPGELTTAEGRRLLEEIASFSQPILIMTGGEPLMRPDIFELIAHGSRLGLRMVLSSNGTPITAELARQMVESGVKRLSISLDGATAASHDRFRQMEGAFEGSLRGIELIKAVGLEFQINTTITQCNLSELAAIQELACRVGAAAHHIFLLVPTGRGKELAEQEISAADYEQALHWFYDQREQVPLHLKATCAPHYYRILRQRAREEGKTVTPETFGLDAMTKGCLGGQSFAFISHRGEVQICGYLEVKCGDVREQHFREIWEHSPVFLQMRDLDRYHGRCGHCEYRRVCGGCRARAYAATGDYLGEEPLCTHQPRQPRSDSERSGDLSS
ncbi:MAG: heme b synthase [Candidatus Tectomicrobia bacterium]|uniref:Heme b synthase n=1 Tax=Tectimicrobiota bacterium TaxID=2528274 RepID=A0A932CR34_UNCTE|nr:heme b synthase [Candidatus Tectomicrobia bacterium]